MFSTDQAECCVWSFWGCAALSPPSTHPLHLCVLQIPSCIIPVYFLDMGLLGREMGRGSPTVTKKVSSEFLNVPGIEACCIPTLQFFQGQTEEKVCRLFRVQIQKKKKNHPLNIMQHTQFRQTHVAFHMSPCLSAVSLLLDHPEIQLPRESRTGALVRPSLF